MKMSHQAGSNPRPHDHYTANPSKLNKIYFLILRLLFLKQENFSDFLRKIILIRKYSEK